MGEVEGGGCGGGGSEIFNKLAKCEAASRPWGVLGVEKDEEGEEEEEEDRAQGEEEEGEKVEEKG